MRFESSWVFLILLIVPLLVFFSYRKRGWGSLRFSSTTNAKRLNKSLKQRLMKLPLVLRILTLLFLVLAIARPQEGKRE
jgi:Ca-activated chloride channel family protein